MILSFLRVLILLHFNIDFRRTWFHILKILAKNGKGEKLPESFPNPSRILPESFPNPSRILPESFPNPSRILPEYTCFIIDKEKFIWFAITNVYSKSNCFDKGTMEKEVFQSAYNPFTE